jgi:hypothetical protein
MACRMPSVEMTQLILKRSSASRPSGQWSDKDYDVLADGKVVGRIYEDVTLARRQTCDGSGPSLRSCRPRRA